MEVEGGGEDAKAEVGRTAAGWERWTCLLFEDEACVSGRAVVEERRRSPVVFALFAAPSHLLESVLSLS